MMASEVLDAIRDMVEQAEADGWDVIAGNREILQRARVAHAALQIVMVDADNTGNEGRA